MSDNNDNNDTNDNWDTNDSTDEIKMKMVLLTIINSNDTEFLKW